MSGQAANDRSQRIAHSSSWPNAGGLHFRVRDGYGCVATAVAAFTPTSGVEPLYAVVGLPSGLTAMYVQSSLRLDPSIESNESQCEVHECGSVC